MSGAKKELNQIKFDDELNLKLLKQYHDCKDAKIRDKIILNNRPLIMYVLSKLYPKNILQNVIKNEIIDDLLQEGTVGLMEALERFDVSLGYKFSTYASWWVRHSISNYLLNYLPEIKIPNHIRIAETKINKYLFDQKKSIEELSDCDLKELDMTRKMAESVKKAMATKKNISLSQEVSSDSKGLKYQDFIIEPIEETSESFDKEKVMTIVKNVLKNMPKKRRTALLLRYGVLKEENFNFGEIDGQKEK